MPRSQPYRHSERRFRAALPHELDGPLRLTDIPIYIERIAALERELHAATEALREYANPEEKS